MKILKTQVGEALAHSSPVLRSGERGGGTSRGPIQPQLFCDFIMIFTALLVAQDAEKPPAGFEKPVF